MTTLHGFELIRDEHIPEINSRARLYRHLRTGARLLSIENDDENKVFSINFRTPPGDSSGVAHIMEHSVLCGSRKYPVKEPFVELMKGSLNTFLNAFTFPDKTCYPVASQNVKDFYNLIDVYLDAVFYPNLSRHTFEQEGWHYELDRPEEEMSFKGVVFNEMKGAYSTPDEVLSQQSQAVVFPDVTYGQDSGGDPRRIPDLTYEAFTAFHERYYHPSNAMVYFYGDDDPEQRLAILDVYLKDFNRRDVHSAIPLQQRFPAPRRMTTPYEVTPDDEAPTAMLTVNWMLPEGATPLEKLAFGILNEILIGTSAAPLRKALIDSGLGEDLAGRGMDTGLAQMLFSVGMKGVKPADVDRVESLILETLKKLSVQGIDGDTIAAAMNTVEFSLRENNTGSFPRGLAMMLRAMDSWLYDRDPLDMIRFEQPLNEIKAKIRAGRFFEGLIETHLVNNPHRGTVILLPDANLAVQREAEEKLRLKTVRDGMSVSQVEEVVQHTRELKLRQQTPDSPEALATIPVLTIADLDQETRKIPSIEMQQGDARMLHHDLFTNGILYLDLGFDLHTLPQELLPYVPLFANALLETGTDRLDFVQLVQRIGRNTGGIYHALFHSMVPSTGKSTNWLILRGKAMVPQTTELLSILRDVLRSARLDDRERLRQMVLEEKAGFESMLTEVGHRIVNLRIKAGLNEADWAAEQMTGVSQLLFLRELAEQMEKDWPAVQARLEQIRSLLVCQSNLIANVTVDADNWRGIEPQLRAFLDDFSKETAAATIWQRPSAERPEAITLPSQVNFVGKGFDLYRDGYPFRGSLLVALQYVRSTWLWERVRVQGGAYGGMGAFDRYSGIFSLLSYRDPNLDKTLSIYDQTANFLRTLNLDTAELNKSIIGVIGELDAYLLPDAKGYTALTRHLLGVTDEERQQMRDEVLSANEADFHALGEALEQFKERGEVVVMGSPQAVEASKVTWAAVKRIL
ncbi:pre-sequence protease. Metallo peptidase. MEROPS family M16C [Longilinea arvoryzae]|uniref:Pre-sequence protease. Metallo peptidase. MEROPS family M16C n=1 Tax=Longilinea arvoryzae TaxID=360412 RepID=A0A0S7BM77_9CHLR|nr:insulinase family protein [Longilinea arvoryzae]GAP15099.1 pre-sequence protease. Metallo peptidase. MEROPS family M16C [Longilinea arvoryzae]